MLQARKTLSSRQGFSQLPDQWPRPPKYGPTAWITQVPQSRKTLCAANYPANLQQFFSLRLRSSTGAMEASQYKQTSPPSLESDRLPWAVRTQGPPSLTERNRADCSLSSYHLPNPLNFRRFIFPLILTAGNQEPSKSGVRVIGCTTLQVHHSVATDLTARCG